MKGSREFYNPHKVWDAGPTFAVAEIAAQYIPQPVQEEKGEDHGEVQ